MWDAKVKDYHRKSSDFQVTVKDLCNHCKELKEDVEHRRQYVYLHGYVEQVSCEDCFKTECEARSKSSPYDGYDVWSY